ncbi:MAG TPA: large-conductance mechanosensitive channel protein MscL [Elusimicrobiota bacterium]|nr:large-conductance mechanosensitive channel protein MscL [Elusimicrobiota bacterium]
MKIMNEFKEFAMRGNVVDMAVGIIIGGAFGKIVSSFINDVIMPPLGFLIGNADFSDLEITLKAGVDGAKPVVLAYGKFVTVVVDFLIVAFAVFLMVRLMNKMKRAEPAPVAVPTEKKCPECQMLVPIEAKRCGHCTATIAS